MVYPTTESGASAQEMRLSPGGVRRVLMSADTVGGVWSYSLELAAALGKHGVQVLLAIMGGQLNRTQRVEVAGARNVQVAQGVFPSEWLEGQEVDEAGQWLLGLAEAFQPDVVHLDGYAHASLKWKVPALVVAHSCLISRWQALNGAEAPVMLEKYRKRVAEGLHAAGATVAPTRAALDALKGFYGKAVEATVIANGIRGSGLRPGSGKQCRFLASGRVCDEGKNFRLLDQAADSVRWPVLLAGTKKAEQRFSNLHLLGPLSRKEMAGHCKEAAVFVSPSFYEPFGLTEIAAARCGCALLLSDLPSYREVWEEDALYFESGDVSALREAMQELSRNPRLREGFADRAYRRSMDLGADRMAQDYFRLYNRLCEVRV